MAIYVDQVLKKQCRYKLQNCCSNNEAEQVAVLKSLEELTSLSDHNARTVAIYTDSKVTLASQKQFYTQHLNRRHTKQGSTTHDADLVNPFKMSEDTC